MRRLALLGIRAREIRVTGGGARSAAWRQIMADVFGVPVVAMVEDEGAALGAALQAAWCAQRRSGRGNARIGDFTAGVVVPDESTRCRPDAKNVALYREIQSIQDDLSLALRGLFTRHAKLAARIRISSPGPA